ncbi:MAG TPA: hypothetical protein PLT47_00915 [Bacteroidales bacterium]|nr:hypothetical protein [Bacteroidales bacterium]
MKNRILSFCFLLFINIAVFAQWQQTMGPFSGAVSCFTFSGTGVYTGTPDGVYQSMNGGNTWTALNNGMQNIKVRDIALNGSTLIACTENGAYRSTDYGQSWALSNNGLPAGVSGQQVVFKSPAYFFATNSHGLFMSSDNGVNWSAVSGLAEMEIRVLLLQGDSLWAGTPNGAFLSVNNGVTWSAMNTGLTLPVNPPFNVVAGVFSFFAGGGKIYAGTSGGVYQTPNGGASWIRCSQGLPDSYSGTFPVVTSLTKNGTRLYAGVWNQGLFTSDNDGTLWDDGNPTMMRRCDKNLLTLKTYGGKVYAGSEQNGGVQITDDNGSTWRSSNTGLPNTTPVALFAAGMNVFTGTSAAGLFSSPDQGLTWRWDTAGISNTQVKAFAVAGSFLFAGTAGGGVFKSANNGDTWTSANGGLSNSWVYALCNAGTTIYAGTANGGVFVSTDFGASWNNISIPMTVQNVETLAANGNTIFAGTSDGVYVSYNNGAAWQAPGTGIQGVAVTSLAFSGGNVFAGSPGAGVFFSSDAGISWTAVNNGIVPVVFSMAASGNHVFAATVTGLFQTSDNGTSWTNISANLPPIPVVSLAVSTTRLYAGVDTKGVWQRDLAGLVGIVENNAEADQTQVVLFPNPVKDILNLELDLASDGLVTITMTEVSGKQSTTLMSSEMKSGRQMIHLNLSEFAAGSYLINFSVARDVFSRIIVKE